MRFGERQFAAGHLLLLARSQMASSIAAAEAAAAGPPRRRFRLNRRMHCRTINTCMHGRSAFTADVFRLKYRKSFDCRKRGRLKIHARDCGVLEKRTAIC